MNSMEIMCDPEILLYGLLILVGCIILAFYLGTTYRVKNDGYIMSSYNDRPTINEQQFDIETISVDFERESGMPDDYCEKFIIRDMAKYLLENKIIKLNEFHHEGLPTTKITGELRVLIHKNQK